MKEKFMKTIKKIADWCKKNPVKAIAAGVTALVIITAIIIMAAVSGNSKPSVEESSAPVSSGPLIEPGILADKSRSLEDLEKINFGLANTSKDDIDSAIAFVNAKVDEEGASPYVVSFKKEKVYASEESTVYFRRAFFMSDYAERYKLTDTYVNHSTIAILAEYTADYDEAQISTADGKTTRAFYLMKSDATGEWSIYKMETLSVE